MGSLGLVRHLLAGNVAYAQFIVGDDIAIITVHLTRARVCDVNDKVTHFSRDANGKRWTELNDSSSFNNGPGTP